MAKFKRSGKKGMQAISTASLPDIVFMLLFFFMVTTVMREVTMMVNISVPSATEIEKLEKKSLVSYIYIGEPKDQFKNLYGSDDRIQLNDQFATPKDIREFISAERDALGEVKAKQLTVSLKVDSDAKMGIVTDVKQELRKASALKINYSTKKNIKVPGLSSRI